MCRMLIHVLACDTSSLSLCLFARALQCNARFGFVCAGIYKLGFRVYILTKTFNLLQFKLFNLFSIYFVFVIINLITNTFNHLDLSDLLSERSFNLSSCLLINHRLIRRDQCWAAFIQLIDSLVFNHHSDYYQNSSLNLIRALNRISD